jgi:hypothetical protein
LDFFQNAIAYSSNWIKVAGHLGEDSLLGNDFPMSIRPSRALLFGL